MRLQDHGAPIFVAGHRGLVGSAVVQRLQDSGYRNTITRSRKQLDLRDQSQTDEFFEQIKPDYVVVAAARVGGILANDRQPADFIADNLLIQTNVLLAAARAGVKRLVFLGSSCMYPKHAPQPISEAHLLTGPLEPTNQWYAVAKIAGLKLCQALSVQHGADFVTLMPTNLYGPNDNFDLETSHVLPALLRKFHEAARDGSPAVTVWGSGKPRREFLYSADLADAVLFTLECPESNLVSVAPDRVLNIGTGEDIEIGDLAYKIREIVDTTAEIVFDRSKPEGTPRKLLDVTRIASLGWKARTLLEEGLRATYHWYLEHVDHEPAVGSA